MVPSMRAGAGPAPLAFGWAGGADSHSNVPTCSTKAHSTRSDVLPNEGDSSTPSASAWLAEVGRSVTDAFSVFLKTRPGKDVALPPLVSSRGWNPCVLPAKTGPVGLIRLSSKAKITT